MITSKKSHISILLGACCLAASPATAQEQWQVDLQSALQQQQQNNNNQAIMDSINNNTMMPPIRSNPMSAEERARYAADPRFQEIYDALDSMGLCSISTRGCRPSNLPKAEALPLKQHRHHRTATR